MGKLVVTEFVTLDGVMEDPGGGEDFDRGGWAFTYDFGEAGGEFKNDELMAADAQLLGRVTYQAFASAWPDHPEGETDFGKRMNTMPKYVVSKTLTSADWENSTILAGDMVEEVRALKQRLDNVLVAGSAQLVQGLLAADLVDELRLMIFPVVVGSGKRLFDDAADLRRFELVETAQSADVVLLTLRRKAD